MCTGSAGRTELVSQAMAPTPRPREVVDELRTAGPWVGPWYGAKNRDDRATAGTAEKRRSTADWP